MNQRSINIISFLFGLLLVTLILGCPKNTHDITGDDNDDTDPVDSISPHMIADLRLTEVDIARVRICWTAPGDDGDSGIAAAYELRLSHDSLTPINFDSASPVWTELPAEPGTEQCVEISEMDGELTYYAAIRTRDEKDNWSELSNCLRIQCLIDSIVFFPDSMLEVAVRNAISRPIGPIRRSFLDTVTAISGSAAGITNLSGLEYCPRLRVLNVQHNEISHLEPIRELDSLETLLVNSNQITSLEPIDGLSRLTWLEMGNNPITDLSPIANLTGLISLSLYQIPATDFSFLRQLTHLERVAFANNDLSDLSVLSSATGLTHIALFSCNVSDLSELQGLTALHILTMPSNQIVDLLPLVNNTGLSEGDELLLTGNPLSDSSITVHIPALQARGVIVSY